MNERDRDAFARWQGRAVDQMSFVTNLLVGLATGLLALQVQAVLDNKIQLAAEDRLLGLSSVVFLSLSLLVGLVLAWNRLQDFRKTARVVREKGQDPDVAAPLREEVRALGEGSWRFLTLQIITFALGAVAFVALVAVRV